MATMMMTCALTAIETEANPRLKSPSFECTLASGVTCFTSCGWKFHSFHLVFPATHEETKSISVDIDEDITLPSQEIM